MYNVYMFNNLRSLGGPPSVSCKKVAGIFFPITSIRNATRHAMLMPANAQNQSQVVATYCIGEPATTVPTAVENILYHYKNYKIFFNRHKTR